MGIAQRLALCGYHFYQKDFQAAAARGYKPKTKVGEHVIILSF